jgi:hypothetical protein
MRCLSVSQALCRCIARGGQTAGNRPRARPTRERAELGSVWGGGWGARKLFAPTSCRSSGPRPRRDMATVKGETGFHTCPFASAFDMAVGGGSNMCPASTVGRAYGLALATAGGPSERAGFGEQGRVLLLQMVSRQRQMLLSRLERSIQTALRAESSRVDPELTPGAISLAEVAEAQLARTTPHACGLREGWLGLTCVCPGMRAMCLCLRLFTRSDGEIHR